MKQIISIVLCLCLLYCLTGCGSNNPSSSEAVPSTAETKPIEPSPTASAETTLPTVQYQLPLISVCAPPIAESYPADDGTELLRYTYQDIRLTLEDPQVADAVVMDFLNLVDPANASVHKILKDARDAYQETEDWRPYSFRRSYNPMRLDANILSMYGTQILSTDSSHGTTAGISATYDLLTGQRLTLKQVMQTDFSADSLSQAIVGALSVYADDGILYSDHAYVISEMFSTNTPMENWYFTNNGLCFYFAPYEIAPYNAGIIAAEIPYAELSGLLRDEYFPPEQIDLSGTLSVQAFTEADLSHYTQFAELILDPQGNEYLIHASGVLGQVRMEQGSWQSDGSFISERTLLAAATLCQNDAVVIQIPTALISSIRITYVSEGEIVSVPLSSFIASD